MKAKPILDACCGSRMDWRYAAAELVAGLFREVRSVMERNEVTPPAWDEEMDEPIYPSCPHSFKFRRDSFCQECGQRMEWF